MIIFEILLFILIVWFLAKPPCLAAYEYYGYVYMAQNNNWIFMFYNYEI